MIDESGRPRDELARLQARLEDAEDSVRAKTAMLDASLDAIVSMDFGGQVAEWNAAAEQIFGWSRAEAVGRELADLIIPERDRQRHRDGLRRFRESGESRVIGRRIEMRALHKLGHEFPVELAITVSKTNGATCYTGFIRDISPRIEAEVALVDSKRRLDTALTEQKRGEGELAETVSLLRATLDATTDGILVVDAGGRITSFNRRFIEMWRIPESVIATKDDNRALACVLEQLEEPDQFLAKVRELYRQADAESFDVLRFKDGRVFERFSLPQRIDGLAVGRVWSFRDATERLRLEEERNRLFAEERAARKLAEGAVNSREEFVSVASHELRTPLTSLLLALDTSIRARAKFAVNNDCDRVCSNAIEVAARQGRRLERLIDCLLDLSRLDTGQFHLDLSPVDLSRLVNDVVLQSKPDIDKAACALSVSLAEGADGVWDRARLEQVVMNLLSNAIKYGAGSSVEIALHADAEEVTLSVADHGIGIAADACDRVFDRYERGVSASHYGGLGLGLYIVRRIVEAHGGTISVTSALGSGSTFVVKLPRRAIPRGAA